MPPKETIDDTFLKDNIAAYDAVAKSLLSRKIFLARILKRCVREFADCTVEDIMEKYIENKVEVGTVPVAPDKTNAVKKIDGDNVEYKTLTEGETTFDIRFTAYAPTTGEPIKLIINIEAQRKVKPGYSLIKRAIFHGSRLMSSEYNVEFVEPNFDDIKKVISIWICFASPKKDISSIMEYSFAEKSVVESIPLAREDFDLMQIVMVYVGKDPALIEDELLKLLHLVFRAKLNAAEKKDKLKLDYDIEMDNEALKEVNVMCNLGEGLYEEAYEEGGENKAIELTANMLREKISSDIISRITSLPIDQITAIGKMRGLL
ncbi:MAG: nuclease [Selenomonadaceae bacterium]|nr:nuclease [Selenomonadaceae bacterium]